MAILQQNSLTVQRIATFLLIIIIGIGCQGNNSSSSTSGVSNPAATAKADANAPQATYTIGEGQINWVGKKAIGSQHIGTVKIKGGSVKTKGNDIIGGNVEIDMTSIENNDLEGEKKGKLEGHLRSPDFFNVEGFPTATLAIKSAQQVLNEPSVTHQLSGDLTIKGITHQIEVKANVSFVGDKMLVATPAFSIDRTKWDVKYGSGLLGTAADQIIDDEIFLVVSLDAKQ